MSWSSAILHRLRSGCIRRSTVLPDMQARYRLASDGDDNAKVECCVAWVHVRALATKRAQAISA